MSAAAAMWKRGAIFVLSLCAVATALASLAPLVVGSTWPGELATHFRVQYLAASLFVAIALGLLGRLRSAAALLPIGIVNALVAGPYVLPRAMAVPDGAAFGLMIVNLEAGNRRFDGLLDIVAREEPDILVLLEYTPQAAQALRPVEASLPYAYRIPRADAWGIALLSRLPIDEANAFELGSTPAIDAVLRGPRRPFRMLGVHLRPPTTASAFTARNAQLDSLAERAAGRSGPLVVAGDFNLSPYSPYFRRWLQSSGLRDTLVGRGLDYTWPSNFPMLGIPIDHAFVSAEFTVHQREALERFGSDHLPLYIALAQD